ncbi:sugar-binding domain-containing protein [Bacillus vallismortis]|uniref:sugar-binding domain-containing protein n=1 Tax=Bacillus vallismortis TaxID=72361 RepID=UPI00209103BE|nr:sugar-binding domain-containing protein [Bacillus vallismortis]
MKSYLGQEHQEYFDHTDVVGDICYNFIDENGRSSLSSWNERVIALELDQLREIPLVIGVACGLEKVQAIKAALEGKLVHVLVTDEQTAQALFD